MQARGGTLGLVVVIGGVVIAGLSISTVFARSPGTVQGDLPVQAEASSGRTVVIYPGEYVVQSGDLAADNAWREGVRPTEVVIRPGDTVVQAADLDLLARWRVDVNSATGELELGSVEPGDNSKAVVNPYLTVPFVACIDCNGNASSTRTIRLSGSYSSSPGTCEWSNPVIGWPSTPASYNVESVDMGAFTGNPSGPPYVNGDQFTVDMTVTMTVWGPFGVWVDILGDLTPAGCEPDTP